jgi:nicotinate-nucleotide adenylyltransferase
MRVGLYFGSFNPIHLGHLDVATYMLNHIPCDEVWLVPSPLNPHKQQETLIPAEQRLQWVQRAVANMDRLSVSDIEFHLGTPSYTHRTLLELKKQFPSHQFVLIMGGDNLSGFHRWQKSEEIASMAPLHVYARPGFETPPHPLPFHATWHQAPLIDISATDIRNRLEHNLSINHLVPENLIEPIVRFFKESLLQPSHEIGNTESH